MLCASPAVCVSVVSLLHSSDLTAEVYEAESTYHLYPPYSVGAAIPSFTNYILAILCFLIAALQIIGFVGVVQVRTPVSS
jgi:hypothetical protein